MPTTQGEAKIKGEVGVNHGEECRPRIEGKISADDPERCNRTLGRLAERKAKDMEVRKKI